jgi:DNA-binding transcriptional LysR family regulator
MDHLQAMRVFAKVVECGSFVRAAEKLKISPAVATRHIGDLENHLRTRLLNRTTRKLSLTEAGQKYIKHVELILQEVDSADAAVLSALKEPAGVLHIYCQLSFGESQLGYLLNLYSRDYPGVMLNVTLSDRTPDLVEEGFDVGFFLSVQKFEGSMIARKLGVAELVICASPQYVRDHEPVLRPEDLSKHTCLNFSYEHFRYHWTVNGPDGTVDVPIKSNMVSNNAELLRQSASAGMGVVGRPSFSLRDDLTSGRLVRLLPDYQLGQVSVFMVYPSRRFLPAKTASFVDFISRQFPRPETDPWSTAAGG